MSYLETKVHWWPADDPAKPWAVWYASQYWEIAVNDGPGKRRYSLIIDGKKVEDFDDWPEPWTKAADNGGAASQREEYEYERQKFEKNKNVKPLSEDDLEDDD